MGFGLHTIAHLAGDVASPALNGAGAVTGINTLTNAGHAIGNPNVTLANPTNLGLGGQSGFSYAAPGSKPTANTGQAGSNGYGQGLTTTTPNTSVYTGGGSGSGGAAASNVNLNQPYLDLISSALGRLPGQLNQALGQVQNTYDQNLNELNSGKAAADQNYQTSTGQNQQQFVTNKNQISSQESNGINSLLRVLGQHGAGGSSAALYAAPNAVGQVAAQQRAGAGQTFGQNAQALDTNYNSYLGGFDNSKKQLADWLTQQQNAAHSNSEQSRQGLLQQQLGLQPSVAAAAPIVSQINQSASKVDSLGAFNPTYTGTTPTYNAPDVASYTVNQTGAPELGTPGNGTGAGTPFLNFLLGQKDKNQHQFGA